MANEHHLFEEKCHKLEQLKINQQFKFTWIATMSTLLGPMAPQWLDELMHRNSV